MIIFPRLFSSHPQFFSFPIWIDGVRVRAHGVDPPPGCGALSAFLFPLCPLQTHIPLGEREERAREWVRVCVWESERERQQDLGEEHRKKKRRGEKTQHRHKWHSWQGFCSRPLFLFLGFLHLFLRHGYIPQMKVRSLGGKLTAAGLHPRSPASVRLLRRGGSLRRAPVVASAWSRDELGHLYALSGFCGAFMRAKLEWEVPDRARIRCFGSDLDRASCGKPGSTDTFAPSPLQQYVLFSVGQWRRHLLPPPKKINTI